LLDRDCPHRGADLSYGRAEPDGLRCPFHGWKFDTTGQCTETPGEPEGSKLCTRIKQRSYPLALKNGVIFAWLGAGSPPAFATLDCFEAPATHSFAFKGLLACNWLQALEVGIDPAHASFLHRYFEDESLDASYGRQFRGASAGSDWPMTRVLREFPRPDIKVDATDFGLQLTALRKLNDDLMHVRVTQCLFPQAFVIPLAEDITITQWHVPVDDTHTYWYAMFTGYQEPLDHAQMRAQRLKLYSLPDYVPRVGAHNRYGFNAAEQRSKTYTGMGDDINVHDQWAVESPGAIADRTREHLGTTDKAIMLYRRKLISAIEAVQTSGAAPVHSNAMGQVSAPQTVDCIAPLASWEDFAQQKVATRRAGVPW
jgi:phthalate 4,5-dioxygenase